MLNNFLKCSAYENIIFFWVMHEQSIISSIIEKGIRTADVIERSVSRIPLYRILNTIKIDTNEKTVAMIAHEIITLDL